jgi:hypothetical protein
MRLPAIVPLSSHSSDYPLVNSQGDSLFNAVEIQHQIYHGSRPGKFGYSEKSQARNGDLGSTVIKCVILMVVNGGE